MNSGSGRLVNTWILGAVAACLLAGCSHYKVTDPNSGKVYYTESVHHTKHEGFIKFKDAKTGGEVTLQSSNVEKIGKEEFETAVGKK